MKKPLLTTVIFSFIILTITSCQSQETMVPSDFSLLINVRSARGFTNHYHILIDATGRATYKLYDTGGTIEYDTDGMIKVPITKIVETGKFELNQQQLNKLQRALEKNAFFTLERDYQMAIGHSFAFVHATMDGQQHTVDNIGMEVPELRAIVSTVQQILPTKIKIDYGEGFKP